jgi:hypothetical protein
MVRSVWLSRISFFLFLFLFIPNIADAQKKTIKQPKRQAQKQTKQQDSEGREVMWERVNIGQRDLFDGPGGKVMRPDLSKITFIKEEKGGHNKKYRIKDGAGRVWIAKLGREAQPETAAVRLMYGLGYKTEINYLVPNLTIPGKGTFKNVRLEARPESIDRLENWGWKKNPFMGTNEFQALKILMVFFNNWDILDIQNKILRVDGRQGPELHYIVSDMGSTFGKLGNNNLPIIYRLGRKTGNPEKYFKSSFVKEIEGNRLKLAYKGKLREIFRDITVNQGRWLADLLVQLNDQQIRDAFRAANYSESQIDLFTRGVKKRITELDNVTNRNLALQK